MSRARGGEGHLAVEFDAEEYSDLVEHPSSVVAVVLRRFNDNMATAFNLRPQIAQECTFSYRPMSDHGRVSGHLVNPEHRRKPTTREEACVARALMTRTLYDASEPNRSFTAGLGFGSRLI